VVLWLCSSTTTLLFSPAPGGGAGVRG
jgi:hypothetical protein